jgi:hypothetical protein
MLVNFKALLIDLSSQGLTFTNPGVRLTIRDLVTAPLIDHAGTMLRVDTVHQIKGESIDGVLYVATTTHARGFFTG